MKKTLKEFNSTRKKTLRITLRIIETILEVLHRRGIKNYNSYLAEKMGTSRPYITRIFKGDGNITMKSLVRLLDASGLEMEIKFFDRETLEPINYLAVNTVDIKLHQFSYKRDEISYDRDLENLRKYMGLNIAGLSQEHKVGKTSARSESFIFKTVRFSPEDTKKVLV